MVIFAVFVVGEGEFTVLVRFLGEMELKGVIIAGVRVFAVSDFTAPAISTLNPS